MNLGFTEIAFIFIVALIIFGPKKLPEIGRQIGKALNEFKRASNEFKAQIEHEINQLDVETEPQILPPASPPAGVVANLPEHQTIETPPIETQTIEKYSAEHHPEAEPEASSLSKAPDA